MENVSLEQARMAKPNVKRLLDELAQDAAVGITRGDSGYAVKVNLAGALRGGIKLPREVDGVPLVVETVGPIKKRGLR